MNQATPETPTQDNAGPMDFLNIRRLKFKVGAGIGQTLLEIDPRPIVILVGPINSEKSLALREIEDWYHGPGAGLPASREHTEHER